MSSAYTIDQVVESYVAIRDVKRTMEKEHEEALKPIQEKLDNIEAHLLGRMLQDGVENYKTKSGTAYKSVKVSCQMADAVMYKEFVFAPLARTLSDQTGLPVDAIMVQILGLPLWNLTDFRALKKGVEEYIEDNSKVPPGLNVAQTTTVNVRNK